MDSMISASNADFLIKSRGTSQRSASRASATAATGTPSALQGSLLGLTGGWRLYDLSAR